MARVTVEDCVSIINNRFELVLLASQRARDIAAGMELTVDRDNDKNPVIALREVAEQSIDFEELRRHIVRGVNRHSDMTIEDDSLMSLSGNVPGMEEIGLPATEIQELDYQSEEESTGEVEAAPTEEEVEESISESEMEEITEGDSEEPLDQEIIG